MHQWHSLQKQFGVHCLAQGKFDMPGIEPPIIRYSPFHFLSRSCHKVLIVSVSEKLHLVYDNGKLSGYCDNEIGKDQRGTLFVCLFSSVYFLSYLHFVVTVEVHLEYTCSSGREYICDTLRTSFQN